MSSCWTLVHNHCAMAMVGHFDLVLPSLNQLFTHMIKPSGATILVLVCSAGCWLLVQPVFYFWVGLGWPFLSS